jgi:hypothetical protein
VDKPERVDPGQRKGQKMKPWKNVWTIPQVVPVNVPDGKSGDWEVYTFNVSKADEAFGRIRAIASSDRGRFVPAGAYKGLRQAGTIVMSNTPDEIADCSDFFSEAKGRVLINGLGLGIALDVILNKLKEDDSGRRAVEEVYVVEKSQDVLNLVEGTFKDDPRVKIVHADALEYKPIGKFDAVWHDIWSYICSDNLPEMHKLHRKYGRKLTESGWQGSWCQERVCRRA